MNKKLFYAAMALPMLFTACSQDELFEEANGGMNIPKVKGYKVDLVTTKGDVTEGTRADWTVNEDGAGLIWSPADKISVYWLNTENGKSAIKGHFNSVYETGDGSNFTSKSLIYQGGNVAVFPADLAHTSIKTVDIKIAQNQGEDYANNTPYISNYLNVGAGDHLVNQKPGYEKPLFAPLKQAANVVTFDFTLKNTDELVANEKFNFQVTSVSLVARDAAPVKGDENGVNAFATKANIVNGDRLDGTNTVTTPATDGFEEHNGWNHNCSWTPVTKVLKVSASATIPSLTATYVKEIDRAAGKYQATFVVLPTNAKGFNQYSDIVIETTCGRINLTTTETSIVDKEEVTVPVAEFTEAEEGDEDFVAPEVAGAITNTKSGKVWTIKQMLDNVVAYGRNTGGQFKGEQVGKTFMLSFEADMSNATLNDSKVYNSTMIENYVDIYKAMNSTEKMNLVLSTQAASDMDQGFNHLTAAAVNAVHGCNKYGDDAKNTTVNVTLSIGNVDKVWIEGGGEVSAIINDRPSGKYNASLWAVGTHFDLYLRNAQAAWTMNDSWSNSHVNKVVNQGTLNISGTTYRSGISYFQSILTSTVENKNVINIAGNGTLKVGTKLTNNGTVNVAAEQDLRFNQNTTIGGIINVAADAFLTVEKDIVLTSSANINNAGTVSSVAGNGGLVNDGIITVTNDAAITYVQDNNKRINLKNRNDEVKVYGNKGDIVYNYTAADGSEFVRTVADKFTDVVFDGNTSILELTDNNISDIDMTFNGTTEILTNGQEIRDLTVNGHLKLTTPDLGYDKTLFVRSLTNNKNITIGGTIYYTNNFVDNGTVRSVGDGAILRSVKSVSTLSALKAALANGNDVKVTKAIEITENTTLNLNGCTITNAISETDGCGSTGNVCSVFYLNTVDATLTIEGEGNVTANAADADYNIPVWVRRGTAYIKGGNFLSGADSEGGACHAVYAQNSSKVYISGGTFKAEGNIDGMAVVAVLNGTDADEPEFILSGGSFYGFGETQAALVGADEVDCADGYKWSASASNGYYSVVAE